MEVVKYVNCNSQKIFQANCKLKKFKVLMYFQTTLKITKRNEKKKVK